MLKLESRVLPVYCHMTNDLGACGGGGWTLVMKIDGSQVLTTKRFYFTFPRYCKLTTDSLRKDTILAVRIVFVAYSTTKSIFFSIFNFTKPTFHYNSSLWTNKTTFHTAKGGTGFDTHETKLPTYWTTPFSKICLGMKIDQQINFILIEKKSPALCTRLLLTETTVLLR